MKKGAEKSVSVPTTPSPVCMCLLPSITPFSLSSPSMFSPLYNDDDDNYDDDDDEDFYSVNVSVLKQNAHCVLKKKKKKKVTEADFICSFCSNEGESGIHFILFCPTYNELRDKYIPRKYSSCPFFFKLTMLFSTENKSAQRRLSAFLIYKASDIRFFFLSGQMPYLRSLPLLISLV